ncbi:RidA family protein [Burkholderia stabilis]|uniref:RidA family protein n=1 Tax=Burkholderia stabilis TaxID=95485 RepID=UPI001F4A63B4|nr:RidA family protein [Burkholderia stabilis]
MRYEEPAFGPVFLWAVDIERRFITCVDWLPLLAGRAAGVTRNDANGWRAGFLDWMKETTARRPVACNRMDLAWADSETAMNTHFLAAGLVASGLLCGCAAPSGQQAASISTPLEYVQAPGQYVIPVPLAPAVKAGNLVFVSGIPAYDRNGKLAVGDFTAQMNQAMENITGILKAAGTGWDRVVKVDVMLIRREDFKEMNRIYAGYFHTGQYPARSTAIVTSLPNPDFLVEIDCIAVVDKR